MTDKKLDAGQQHLLRLISRDQKSPTGWAKVSKQVMPLIQALPSELVEIRLEPSGAGLAMLTEKGQSIIDAMEYLS